MSRFWRLSIAVGLAAGLLAPSGTHAERGRDQDDARRAVELGEALSLADILKRIGAEFGGEVVGVSFERKRGRWIYEFKVVRKGGQLGEVYVDAASAEILQREEH